ncbi:MAG: TMEM165/GDT1 family protein [Thermoproteota archaeon]|nr:TMEM165/GDT1 family protein [Candidatus Brockarchaeota archaeon]
MDLTPLFASLILVTLAELGDKTQLAIITLSSCFNALNVFIGAILALILVSGVGVVIGDFLAVFIPQYLVNIMSAVLFLLFGLFIILTRNKEEGFKKLDAKCGLLSVFSMVALMELGDKTQIAVIALAAEYNALLLVYIGVNISFILLTGLGVLLGKTLIRLIPVKSIKIVSGTIFLLFGTFLLLNTLRTF